MNIVQSFKLFLEAFDDLIAQCCNRSPTVNKNVPRNTFPTFLSASHRVVTFKVCTYYSKTLQKGWYFKPSCHKFDFRYSWMDLSSQTKANILHEIRVLSLKWNSGHEVSKFKYGVFLNLFKIFFMICSSFLTIYDQFCVSLTLYNIQRIEFTYVLIIQWPRDITRFWVAGPCQ